MTSYSTWISWFRDVAPKVGASPAAPTGAPTIDADRLERVLKRGNGKAIASLPGFVRSPSPAKRMINWLATLPADVVDAAAQNLNWDQAQEVVLWLLEQPTTDAATAVKLFMRSEPACYVGSLAQDPNYDSLDDKRIIETFTANWTTNRYARGGVGYDPREVSPYGTSDIFFINELNEDLEKHRSNGVHLLPPLPGLAGPFDGPRPKDLEVHLKARGRGELFLARYLFAGLGTWILDDEINENDFDEWMRQNNLSAE